jgi:hypothetical protein
MTAEHSSGKGWRRFPIPDGCFTYTLQIAWHVFARLFDTWFLLKLYKTLRWILLGIVIPGIPKDMRLPPVFERKSARAQGLHAILPIVSNEKPRWMTQGFFASSRPCVLHFS